MSLCGIAGEIRFDNRPSDPAITKAMCDAEIHRGPDDEGYYSYGPVSLGIRRLSIIDLRKSLYPLRNERGTIQFIFNGEVYGFDTLRAELERAGHSFQSNTDAETVVHAYEQWGADCVRKLNGMFAFALWDQEKSLLWIARDHFGIKPLYYYFDADFFTFASEIKPLLVHPEVSVTPNEKVIEEYVRSGLTDFSENTFFQGLRRLPPAHNLFINPKGQVKLEKYWSPRVSRELGGKSSLEEVNKIRELFVNSVRRQLVSDVPVGTCLSGGIDSSSVVCSIARIYPQGSVATGPRIRAFSAAFPDDPVDESKYAKIVCDTTMAESNPVCPTAIELWNDLPTLVRCQEEPFGGSSIYAQWRVMKRARESKVTVLLDGQGGDELLAGYVGYYLNYLLTLRTHRRFATLVWEGLLSYDLTKSLIGAYLRNLPRRILLRALPRLFTTHGSRMPVPQASPMLSDLGALLEMDTASTSLPALLRYEDKNSMWHSIEARVPFLDKYFFEYVASLPLDRKLHKGWTKYVFRLAMKGILPEEIRLRRSKRGFETPEKRWFENELRGNLQEFFSNTHLKLSRFYDVEKIKSCLARSKLRNDEVSLVWRALNLEMWYQEFFVKDECILHKDIAQ